MTPWGAEPAPSATCFVLPERGSSQPSRPEPCAVYQTPPSLAGATSCGCVPLGTANSRTRGWLAAEVAALADAAASSAAKATAARSRMLVDTRTLVDRIRLRGDSSSTLRRYSIRRIRL